MKIAFLIHEGDWRSLTDLQRKVLHYLKDYGPLNWNALYVRFDSGRSGDIGEVLKTLQERKYIEVESDNIARITAWGVERLQNGT